MWGLKTSKAKQRFQDLLKEQEMKCLEGLTTRSTLTHSQLLNNIKITKEDAIRIWHFGFKSLSDCTCHQLHAIFIIFFITSSKFSNPFQLSKKNSINAILGSLHFGEDVSQHAIAE
jgi:hypothetical protein